ncbi:DnaD domain-containing protein [Streptococcus sp. DD12]|uniref:DnaD domain-containing protein n=1 Tax=Streptococcus sp. DD12 TaxID=1777880 RepID=UPI0007941F50|nr:DnaD domain-containing protein [Streptococcus sp. DD12]KXT76297.1 Chromosome replication initiation protein dnaD [Streptococcus sp. DD12]
MSYYKIFSSEQAILPLPSALLLHFKAIFSNADDFLVWQYFYYQNLSPENEMTPGQIAEATGKSLTEINRSIERLVNGGLISMTDIQLDARLDTVFDARPVFRRLDEILGDTAHPAEDASQSSPVISLKTLNEEFERELGRLLSPFELEDLQQTLDEGTRPELVREALKLAVLNGKANWSYINAILRNWRKDGITSLAQVEAQRREHEASQPQNVTVSDDFLQAMDLWQDD